MAKKTVINRALKQIINSHGDIFIQEVEEATEEIPKQDIIEHEVAYEIEQNANAEEFVPDEPAAIEEQPKQPTVAEVVKTTEKEPVPEAGQESSIPDFMKQEEM